MEAHIHEWTNLLIRWIHFIVGVAWIGASFYFNWLENNLDRKPPQEPGIAGNLWAVHGGGFYHLKKFSTRPQTMPVPLHWFKWEAYTTWLSGFGLLIIVYYFNARVYLIDPSVSDISPMLAIVVSLVAIFGSWLVYDLMCRSPLRSRPTTLALGIFSWFALLAWGLSEVLSGRAAYIHIGAAIGTVMVANVFFVIIPAQKEMVSALAEDRELDPVYGKNGLLRSRHNNYLTLPVLFTMISSHFPSTYGNEWNWLVLVLLAVISVAVRHYFNVRSSGSSMIWILPLAFIAIMGVTWITAPGIQTLPGQQSGIENGAPTLVTDDQLLGIVTTRCTSCHAANPSQPGFAIAPKGLEFDSLEKVLANADLIYQTTVVTKIMPLGNLTGMPDEERLLIAQWYKVASEE